MAIDMAAWFTDNTIKRTSERVLAPDAGEIKEILIPLDKGLAISGKVTDPSENPLRRIQVCLSKLEIHDMKDSIRQHIMATFTNESGEFFLVVASEGTYYLHINPIRRRDLTHILDHKVILAEPPTELHFILTKVE